jgi:DNA-binding transcriptional MerR regulator
VAFQPIARKEYYSIGEVCEITGLKPHVLRYWETQFKAIQPVKNRAGNRAYRRREIEMIQLVKKLLYDQKYTIEGARQRIEELRKRNTAQLEAELGEVQLQDTFANLTADLSDLVTYIEAFHRGEVEPGRPVAESES